MVVAESPAEQRVVLHDVPWEMYEQILTAHENHSGPRFTYDRGELEIVSPLSEHEHFSRMLDMLVTMVAEALGIPVFSVGSTTLKRRELARGSEPDSSFYIQSIDRPRNRRRIDLATDPPPDLVIEIDITSPSVSKLPIYAELGVPEVWRYSGQTMRVLVLNAGEYTDVAESRALPGVRATALTEVLRDSFQLDDVAWYRRVREWARGLTAER